MDGFSGKERREYLRYRCDKPVKYSSIKVADGKDPAAALVEAMSKNLSASGLLFATEQGKAPRIGDVIVMELDYRTISICNEVEELALILENKLLGRVARLEDNNDGTFDVGVAFIRKSDPISKNVKKISDIIKKV